MICFVSKLIDKDLGYPDKFSFKQIFIQWNFLIFLIEVSQGYDRFHKVILGGLG